MSLIRLANLIAAAVLAWGCVASDPCGPTRATVARVIDGDTIELTDGTRIRYLMVDTPEIGEHAECFGAEAMNFNVDLVANREIELRYDVTCQDAHQRTLAYVFIDGHSVSHELVRSGHACMLFIPPNGWDQRSDFEALQAQARQEQRGLWSRCASSPCSR